MAFHRAVIVLTITVAGCSQVAEQPRARNSSEAKEPYQKGTTLHDSDPRQAIELLTKSLELNPDAPPALYNRAVAYARVGRDTEAVADLKRLEAVDPKLGKGLRAYMEASAGGYTSIAEHELEAKNFETAIKKCDSALIYNPKWADAWVVKGLAFEGLGDPKKALECFDKGAEIEPNNLFVYINRGDLHLKEKRAKEALADFTKSIELEPTDADAYSRRSAVYLLLEMPEKAAADEAKARELKKKSAEKTGK